MKHLQGFNGESISWPCHSHNLSWITRLSNFNQPQQTCIHKHNFLKRQKRDNVFFLTENWEAPWISITAKGTTWGKERSVIVNMKGLINQKKKNTRETLVTTGIHFVRVWGYNFYSLLLQHFQLNAWATGSLATDSAMMQDWRGTALQLHSAGEVGRCLLLQLFKAPLEVTVIKGTASHLTARKKKAARIHIKANTGNFYKRDTKISHASWNTVLRNINSNTDLPAQKCQSLPGTC